MGFQTGAEIYAASGILGCLAPVALIENEDDLAPCGPPLWHPLNYLVAPASVVSGIKSFVN